MFTSSGGHVRSRFVINSIYHPFSGACEVIRNIAHKRKITFGGEIMGVICGRTAEQSGRWVWICTRRFVGECESVTGGPRYGERKSEQVVCGGRSVIQNTARDGTLRLRTLLNAATTVGDLLPGVEVRGLQAILYGNVMSHEE
jgi:hypothetical protein